MIRRQLPLAFLMLLASSPLMGLSNTHLFEVHFKTQGPTPKLVPVTGIRPAFLVLENSEVDVNEGQLNCRGEFPGFIPVSTAAIQAVSQSGQIGIRMTFRVEAEKMKSNTHAFLFSWGGYNWGPRLSAMRDNFYPGTFTLFFGVPGYQTPTLLRKEKMASGQWYTAEAQIDKARMSACLLVDGEKAAEISGADRVHFRDLTYMRILVGANQLGPMMDKNAQNLFFLGAIKELSIFSELGVTP